jgi:hypothetical protein
MSKVACGVIPDICKLGLGFVDDENTNLDDPDRL